MSVLGIVLLVLLILLLVGGLPHWPYSTGWGYYPSGAIVVILVIVVLLIMLRQI